MHNDLRGEARMSLSHLVADAIVADREREIRARSPRILGLSSGPRHPHEAEVAGLPDASPAPPPNPKPIARPRVAWGG
jgi:hypothetical protein